MSAPLTSPLGGDDLAKVVQPLLDGFHQSEEICRAQDCDVPDDAEIYVQGAGRSRLALFTYGDLRKLAEAIGSGAVPMQAAVDIIAERRRQVEAEGWTPGHDDEHEDGEIARAAAAYAYASQYDEYSRKVGTCPAWWPWDRSWWKPTNSRRDLVKAAALILAEIERLDRATPESSALTTSEA